MLSVTYDPNRPVEDGQYFVRLVNMRHDKPETSDSLGYWCDKGHLKTIAHAVLAHFSYELASHVLNGPADYPRRCAPARGEG